jgi:hypothetical protein
MVSSNKPKPKFGQYMSIDLGTTVKAVNALVEKAGETGNTRDFYFHPLADGRYLIFPRASFQKIAEKSTPDNAIDVMVSDPEFENERVIVTGIYKSDSKSYNSLLHGQPLGDEFVPTVKNLKREKPEMDSVRIQALLRSAASVESDGGNYEGLPASEMLLNGKNQVLGIATADEKRVIRKLYDEGAESNDYPLQRALHDAFTHTST